ncbi:bifunctional 4-hydroxy-2-oxoglutarate aldolase/2-dehydro-3-deoxy-phosphogluconate aldolase [Dactylosporangium fulvum]|uniref:2-dehydro-3-deoxy-phosphogluconate aldolase n=1 Tax=Dactylosporangium fulvum TaxID=53359 RepID=A0ABY5WBZ6_9ACTN|nr:bifunctional 4-hydroxy-2-oxoglutarate aldolase/2-dehydro-3-deoxy-phosphogluconate aldolase [Dactylosporangium fulvum]UWP86865.1 bifunctional 4-hydroxy-2-oxoglutarate aldolase/2-dehydro-3-deoxy-phosphogluconate aldolase [Dactylosporangium fulvum]
MITPDLFARHRLVPVVVLDDAASAEPLADALAAGGLPIAEVTFRTDAAAEAIARMAAHGGVTVGAGTVTTPAQVDAAVEAGARFVVSPGFSAAVVRRCREHGVFALPGATTATEIMTALAEDVTVVKFFPAGTSGGAPAVAALSAPFAQVSFVPTGGIDAESAAGYLALPSVLAVGGSWMVPRKAIAAGEFGRVTDLVAAAVAAAAR